MFFVLKSIFLLVEAKREGVWGGGGAAKKIVLELKFSLILVNRIG